MIQKKYALMLLLGISAINLKAEEFKCEELAAEFENLVDKVYRPNAGLIKDAVKTTTWMYHDRLERAFHSVKKEELDAIFMGDNRLTFDKISNMFFAIKSGELKVSPEAERFLEDLYVFFQDHKHLLDGSPDSSYKILKALQEADRQAGYSASRADSALSTEAGMRKAESVLLDQALREMKGEKNASSKWYDGFLNFFSPHNNRMSQLLNTNNQLRKLMQNSTASVVPVDEALTKYASILSSAEATKLKGIIASTGNQVSEVREAIDSIYKTQLTTSDPIKLGERRLRELGKLTKKFENPKDGSIAKVGEKRIDEMDAILTEARNRKGLGPRPMDDYHPTELEIRNTQYHRETGELRSQYGGHLAKAAPKTQYEVKAKWDITYYHSRTEMRTRQASRQVESQDSDGNVTYSTEYYEEQYMHEETWNTHGSDSGTFTLDASYEEIINGVITPNPRRISPPSPSYSDSTITSASTSNVQIVDADTDWIVKESAKLSAKEKPMVAQVKSSIDSVESLRTNYQKIRQSESERKATYQSLLDTAKKLRETVVSQLESYTKLSDDEIRNLWRSENPEEFRARNKVLLSRYNHLAKRIDLFAEQVNRNVEHLDMQFDIPDYSPQMNEMNAIAAKNNKIKIALGAGTSTAAAGTGGFVYYKSQKDAEEERRRRFNEYQIPEARPKTSIEEMSSDVVRLKTVTQEYQNYPATQKAQRP